MAVSSEKFELCQDEVEVIHERIQSSLESCIRKKVSPESEQFKTWNSRIRSDLIGAKRAIDEMESEARMAPIQFRHEMMEKVRQFRADSARHLNTLNKLKDSARANPIMPVASNTPSHLSEEEIVRRQVLEGHSILDRTTQSIQRSQQVAIETEEVGNEIVNDLGIQREALERTRQRIHETNSEITLSRRILRRLSAGILQNKAVLILIILIEVCILILLIYVKLKH